MAFNFDASILQFVNKGSYYNTQSEQNKIRDMIVTLDFHNADIKHYFRHLAQALVK